MSTIMPKNELVRRALTYMDECIAGKPDKTFDELLDKAGMKFNLSPRDAADLERIFRESHKSSKNR